MPRWLRVIRGMIGTGVGFSIGGGLVGILFGTPNWLSGEIHWYDLIGIAARIAVVSFPIGAVFGGILAATSRGLTLEKLSVRRVAALGAGLGLLYFGLIALNAFRVWSLGDALLNLAILTVMGAGSATGILLLARRGGDRGDTAPDPFDASPDATPALERARAAGLGAGEARPTMPTEAARQHAGRRGEGA